MRIRTVKPEFFTHPEVLRVSVPARLLLLSLLTQADDEGRLYDQPSKIRGLSFGEDDRVLIAKLLEELEHEGRVHRYTVDGRACIEVANFREHQRIDRPRASTIPPRALVDGSSNGLRDLDESSLLEGNGKDRKGKERNARVTAREFDEFYTAYPRHIGRRTAETAYRNARKRADVQTILEGARRLAADPNLEPRYTPHPSTWLNRDGWLDDAASPSDRASQLRQIAQRLADEERNDGRELGDGSS